MEFLIDIVREIVHLRARAIFLIGALYYIDLLNRSYRCSLFIVCLLRYLKNIDFFLNISAKKKRKILSSVGYNTRCWCIVKIKIL